VGILHCTISDFGMDSRGAARLDGVGMGARITSSRAAGSIAHDGAGAVGLGHGQAKLLLGSRSLLHEKCARPGAGTGLPIMVHQCAVPVPQTPAGDAAINILVRATTPDQPARGVGTTVRRKSISLETSTTRAPGRRGSPRFYGPVPRDRIAYRVSTIRYRPQINP